MIWQKKKKKDFLNGSWYDPNKICTFFLHLGNKSIITNDQEAWIYYLFKEVRFHTIIFATSGKHPRLIAENYFKLDFNSQLVLNAATVVREDEIFFRSPCVDVFSLFSYVRLKLFLNFNSFLFLLDKKMYYSKTPILEYFCWENSIFK